MKYKGALSLIQYIPEGTELYAYFSFGNYDEEKEADSFGVADCKIFYYCDDGENEMKRMQNNGFDFKVVNYELVEA
jgi:hypothetical protein